MMLVSHVLIWIDLHSVILIVFRMKITHINNYALKCNKIQYISSLLYVIIIPKPSELIAMHVIH